MSNYLRNIIINENKYWFEVNKNQNIHSEYNICWGVGSIEDDDISKFNRTDRHEQFKLFYEIRKLFIEWFDNNKPMNFSFIVPGVQRLNIYITNLKNILGNEYKCEFIKTEYKPFDLKEEITYYVICRKVENPLN
jgi:hypothetical protein